MAVIIACVIFARAVGDGNACWAMLDDMYRFCYGVKNQQQLEELLSLRLGHICCMYVRSSEAVKHRYYLHLCCVLMHIRNNGNVGIWQVSIILFHFFAGCQLSVILSFGQFRKHLMLNSREQLRVHKI